MKKLSIDQRAALSALLDDVQISQSDLVAFLARVKDQEKGVSAATLSAAMNASRKGGLREAYWRAVFQFLHERLADPEVTSRLMAAGRQHVAIANLDLVSRVLPIQSSLAPPTSALSSTAANYLAREAEAMGRRMVDTGIRIVTFAGPMRSGATTALHNVRDLAERYGWPVTSADFSHLYSKPREDDDGCFLAREFLDAIDLPLPRSNASADEAFTHLRRQLTQWDANRKEPTLLVIDNMDALLMHARDLLVWQRLLAAVLLPISRARNLKAAVVTSPIEFSFPKLAISSLFATHGNLTETGALQKEDVLALARAWLGVDRFASLSEDQIETLRRDCATLLGGHPDLCQAALCLAHHNPDADPADAPGAILDMIRRAGRLPPLASSRLKVPPELQRYGETWCAAFAQRVERIACSLAPVARERHFHDFAVEERQRGILLALIDLAPVTVLPAIEKMRQERQHDNPWGSIETQVASDSFICRHGVLGKAFIDLAIITLTRMTRKP
ncbi:MAG: hypothetical protein K2Q10_01505 [Rhodospirillales bacterium]|nr:hypothetical protein [Rhodospirillales bacterium]